MKKPQITTFSVGAIRVIGNQKNDKEKETFYTKIASSLHEKFDQMSIKELMKVIINEQDDFLREIESETLSNKLVEYTGPISLDQLETLLQVFPIGSTWRLTESVHPCIQKMAKQKITEILDSYGYEKNETSYQKNRRR